MRIRNQSGLTIVELTVGIGLIALVTGVFLGIQMYITRNTVKVLANLENSIDSNLAERILFKELASVMPSYNNLKIKDSSNENFFEYYPDIPSNYLTKKMDREISLKAGDKTEIFFLLEDNNRGSVITYDPTAAYDIGPAPDDFNEAASLTFVSLNKNDFITSMRDSNKGSRAEERFWGQDQMILMDTPARLRPLNSSGEIDMSVPPRSPTFIGYVKELQLATDDKLSGIFNYLDPQDETVTIDSADKFLRLAPANGGGQPLIRLRAVRLIKLYLQKEKNNFKLYRSTYKAGAWVMPLMLADNVSEFRIRRESILNKILTFKIIKNQK